MGKKIWKKIKKDNQNGENKLKSVVIKKNKLENQNEYDSDANKIETKEYNLSGENFEKKNEQDDLEKKNDETVHEVEKDKDVTGNQKNDEILLKPKNDEIADKGTTDNNLTESRKSIKNTLSFCLEKIKHGVSHLRDFGKKVVLKNILYPLLGAVGKNGIKLLLIKLATSSKYEFLFMTACDNLLSFSLTKKICLAGFGVSTYYRKRSSVKSLATALLFYLEYIGYL